MLDRNIIRVSSSPWLAPAVYVAKKSGEIRICIDYRELNKQTVKDAYPLPLPDQVQDCSQDPKCSQARPTFWILAIAMVLEFDFTIKYRRGSSNANADALSRVPTIPSTCAGIVTVPEVNTLEDVVQEQGKDEVLNELQPTALKANHDIISSGHQGVEKNLQRLKRTAYWIGIAKDTELYCRSCMVCQRSKLPMPTPVPMTNIPIGHPWQMLAVDVLQVPVSSRGNCYLLVLQDYFTKWAEAIPMPNQTAECIVGILIDLFSRFGIPGIAL
ncbi:hypothetical protein EMCRGX_G009263 [Ephydatia muelleri]